MQSAAEGGLLADALDLEGKLVSLLLDCLSLRLGIGAVRALERERSDALEHIGDFLGGALGGLAHGNAVVRVAVALGESVDLRGHAGCDLKTGRVILRRVYPFSRRQLALGMRRLRYLRNTRVTYEIKTELNGLNCQFNDLVGLMLDENLSNITGRITAINGQTVTTDIELPEDIWEGIVYISRKDGSYGEYTFYRNDSHSLYLDTYPDIDWDSEFGKSLEYPLFAIGELQLCWVTAVKPESGNRCSLKLINYSEDIFKDDIKENNQ